MKRKRDAFPDKPASANGDASVLLEYINQAQWRIGDPGRRKRTKR